jgi:hypothetical protein
VIIIVPVVTVVAAAAVIIAPGPVVMAMITITTFHIATPAAIHHNAGMIGAFDGHAAISVQPVMDVHVPLGVMQGRYGPIRTLVHRSAVLRSGRGGALGGLA